MGLVKVAGVVCVVLTAQVFAASTVDYTVELSPYNSTYVANYKAGGAARTYFTADGTFGGASLGSAADGQQFAAGSVLTWDLKAAVSGVHSQAGHASDGKPVAGLANLVFNLQLEKLNGANWELVALGSGSAGVQGWYSAINDGTGGSPVAPAAMALSYNIGNLGPGRAVDPWNDYNSSTPDGGPKLGLFTYPTLVAGKLLGQGCGYTAWDRSGAYQSMTSPGVGMATITRPSGATVAGLGVKPICEGQINTAGLAAGTYRLKVTPGAGVNVLRGDIDLYAISAPSFAVAANVVNEDTITFQLATPGSLAVTILPAEAVTAGAQFAVNGGAWQNPGTISLVPGAYTVSYKSLPGWTKPADAVVNVSAGGTTPVTGTYAPANGTLTVTLGPAGAVAAGAQFAVDGGAWQNPGQVSLSPGTHAVTFKPVAGYMTPAAQNPTITSSANTAITGTYALIPSPEINVDAWDGFTRSVPQGQNATPDTLHVSNAIGVGTMSYTAESTVGWVSVAFVAPSDGVATDTEVETITVSYSTAGLSVGKHYASILIDSLAATNSPVELPVEVTIEPAQALPPVVQDGVASVKLQGGVAYGIPFVGHTVINPGGSTNLSVECRAGGVTQVLIPFDVPVTGVDGSIDANSEVVVTGGSITSLDLNSVANAIVVNMTTDNQNGSCVQVVLHNIARVAGGMPLEATFSIACLRGDVTGNGGVDGSDVNAVKSVSGSLLDSSPVMFRRDVTANGGIDGSDVNNVKTLSGNSAPSCP